MVADARYRTPHHAYEAVQTANAAQMANQFLDMEGHDQIFVMLDRLKEYGYVTIEGNQIKRVARVNWGDLMGHLRKQAGILKANKFQTALLRHWNLLEQRKAS